MKQLYFVESIIENGSNTATVVMFPDGDGYEDYKGYKNVEVPLKNLIFKGYKRKKVSEGDYVYYDDDNMIFSNGNNSRAAKNNYNEFINIQQQIIASGRVIDPHTGLPDYSGLHPEYQHLINNK